MIIFKKATDASCLLAAAKQKGKTIGFVPTMGALHDGHLSLIQSAKAQNDLTVCSIFVNPTQFNNADDFKHYPITIERDVEQLVEAGCDVLFLPGVTEIYPEGYQQKHYDLGRLENILEGYYRPGHFQGVCMVVDRLLEIIRPDRLYLGQKDYQQCMVLQKLVHLLGLEKELKIVISPTVREADGLAKSSRNMRLTESERRQATAIFEALNYIKTHLDGETLDQLSQKAQTQLEAAGFSVDYVAIADAQTLEPAHSAHQPLVGLIAATIDNVRLIDNMALN